MLMAAVLGLAHGAAAADQPIHLQLSPKICTLSANDRECRTRVLASWRSPTPESLCLIVLEKPHIKRCWERYSEGSYSMELEFSDDLTFELRDPDLKRVLSSEVLRVIREAIRYRHKRREPWNVFE